MTALAAEGQSHELVGRQVVGVGETFAGMLGAVMRSDELILQGVEPHLACPAAHPKRLADEAMRRGVVGVVEGDVAVALQGDDLPLGQVVGRRR